MGSGQARPSHPPANPRRRNEDMHRVTRVGGLDAQAGRGGQAAECCSGACEEECGHLSAHSFRRSPIQLIDPRQDDAPSSGA
jgi:hypothetical protein